MNPEEEKNQNNQRAEPISETTKKTYLLIFVLGLIVLGLLAIAFLLKPTPPSSTIAKPTPVPAQTTLVISSAPVKNAQNPLKYSADVTINPGQNKVTAVQLELNYNPKELTNVEIAPGTFFDNPNVLLKKIDTVNGRITYAIGVALGQKGASGQKTVAVISFFVAPGSETNPVSINFEPKTSVSAEGYAQSVTKSLTGSTFTLKQPVAPSPTIQVISPTP